MRISIVVAGAQGSGKTTIAHAVAKALTAQGVGVTVIEEGLGGYVDPTPGVLLPPAIAKQFDVQVLTLQTAHVCRKCGCSDDFACPGGCAWVELPTEKKAGLCSQCWKPSTPKKKTRGSR